MNRKNTKKLLAGVMALSMTLGSSSAVCMAEEASAEEPFEMVMTYMHPGTVPKDLQMVEDAVNEITVPEINVKVSLYPISIAERHTQQDLMIASGEKLDLMMILVENGPGVYANKGQLLELDDLFEEYCPDVAAAEGIAMAGGYFNNKLYAIPDEEKMGRQYGLLMRQDLLDKYGFNQYDGLSYEEMDAFLSKVKEGEGENFYMFNSVGSGLGTYYVFNLYDELGSSTASGVLMNGGRDDLEVVNLYATEEYKEHLTWMRKWYEAGYFAKDCTTMTESQVDLMRSGRYLGNLNSVEPDMPALCSQDYGYTMTAIPLTDVVAKTSCYQISEWALPITCENPEKTLEFVNLMYKDTDIANLLRYGIEGMHYVKTDNEGIITYPEGLDANTSGYVNTLGLYGDKSKIYQWEPAPADIFERMSAFNEEANKPEKQSKALGYCFNSDPVKSEISAVGTVIQQYQAALESGSVDPEVVLPEFLEALDAAGIQEVIAENQKQLDEWAANK